MGASTPIDDFFFIQLPFANFGHYILLFDYIYPCLNYFGPLYVGWSPQTQIIFGIFSHSFPTFPNGVHHIFPLVPCVIVGSCRRQKTPISGLSPQILEKVLKVGSVGLGFAFFCSPCYLLLSLVPNLNERRS